MSCTFCSQSRAALSLLSYCYYQMQDFVNAADCYEQLTHDYPDVEEYRLYYAQSLYKACLYEESMKVCCQIDRPEYQHKVRILFLISSFCSCRCCYSLCGLKQQ